MDNARENNTENGTRLEDEELSVERIFENKEVPSWRKQLTIRAFSVSFVLSVMFCFIAMKFNLTTGITPSLNVSAGLLGFFFVKTWTKLLEKSGMLKLPFTRQENTVIQTCVVASSGIAFSGGFGSYLFGMSERVAKQSGESKYGLDYKNPAIGWMISFLFVVSFLGLFSVLPLRKTMIIDFKLTYPTGTATAHLINSFHTPEGAKLAKKQVRELGKFFSFSFFWGFFQWFFKAAEDCGFSNFPTFGLKAYEYKFFFDFSATYVGVGMICPHIINVSMHVGGILSWGILWPLNETRKDPHSLQGLQGYKVFIGIAMILGDGLYNFFKVFSRTLAGLFNKIQLRNANMQIPVVEHSSPVGKSLSFDNQRRTQLFLKEQIPTWFAIGGYFTLAAVSTAILPQIFHQLKWYYVIVIYLFAPSLAFCNAFGCGLTDWSLASTYGKLAIFTIGAWAGASHGGILAGLAACGVMMNIVSTASDIMQDFKTAFPDLGLPTSEYPAPFATVYYSMAKLGVEGFSALPKECLKLCCGFFAASIFINLIRDGLGKKRSWFIPLPMAMAIPFYLGSYFAIDMCVGSLILFVWQKINRAKADAFGPAVASDDCGFSNFPTFGLKAYKYTFFFDFSATNVGVGMICPHIVNISFLLGGILSCGILWPIIETRKGDWYSADLEPRSLRGLYGYKVFIGISMLLGDGLYNFFKVLSRTLADLFYKILSRNANVQISVVENSSPVLRSLSYDDQRRTEVFLKDQIPTWFAIGGYFALAAVSTAVLPHIFHQLKWYYIIVLYIFAPSLAFCNAYGSGLTDCSFPSNYGKLAIFTIGAWTGASHGGILAGIAASGVLLNIASTASDLMQDFKTGYLTLASPCSMFVSQVIGTAMGCVISPCVFWIFYKAFADLGLPASEYPVPSATAYYNMAKLGVEGFSALPKGCLKLCYGFFAASILINLTRDALGKKRSWFIPIPMAMAVPFFLGSQIAVDMCVGSLILYVWQKKNKANADAFGPAVASGLICGEGNT
ncbi:unnamed protein product [Fraxinus pennsylvanica]|uniref:Uncharacterized protein n=1 Tax=Fraxinus pennsylvanica TaxID=56036 RepID=A0AAD1ZQ89_9LAMI|nr:unnamed protein product [Fraxinus pennsylvanica]